MSSYYSIVRYLPSVIAEEFINIGIFTYGDGKVRQCWLKDWNRVDAFCGEYSHGARFLRDEIVNFILTEDMVRHMANTYYLNIQITQPCASLLNPDELMESIVSDFLIEPRV
jgi:hypothetical protein